MFGAKKSGSCAPGDISNYHIGWTSAGCPTMPGWWDPMLKWQKKYTQTCN
jgi:hypothetical protein